MFVGFIAGVPVLNCTLANFCKKIAFDIIILKSSQLAVKDVTFDFCEKAYNLQ